jgi:hypothetical protein
VRILAKIGGAQLEVPERRAQMALAVRRAIDAGHEVVVVHGGGNQIRELGKRLGIPERQHQGLRVTDAETADVVLMVLAGLVNKVLVHDLCAAGVRAVGYAGADAQSFHVAKHEPAGTDIGYVGTIAKVDPALTFALLEQGFTPTIATSAPLAAGAAAARPFVQRQRRPGRRSAGRGVPLRRAPVPDGRARRARRREDALRLADARALRRAQGLGRGLGRDDPEGRRGAGRARRASARHREDRPRRRGRLRAARPRGRCRHALPRVLNT